MRFEDKVAVVTGGGMGIGRAGALAFAAEGAAVAVVDVNAKAAQAVTEEIVSNGGRALAVIADVSKAADAERIAIETAGAFGGIDCVLNNAGVQSYGTVTDTDEETWDRTLNINLKGMYLVARFCIPEMEKRGGGAIVNIASAQGLASRPRVAAYAASKGGLIALTHSMAVDHAAQGIRANCICPGGVDTPLQRDAIRLRVPEDQIEAEMARISQEYPIKRMGRPEEIANVALFLCSDDSSFMTGSVVVADGGKMAAL